MPGRRIQKYIAEIMVGNAFLAARLFFCSSFPRAHYLVWCINRVSVGVRDSVRIMVRVSKLVGSDYDQGKFRVRVKLGLGLVLKLDPNNLLTLTLTATLTETN